MIILKTIGKTLMFTTITLAIGIFALLSNIVTVFDVDIKEYLLENVHLIVLGYLILNFAIYGVILSKKVLSYEKERSNFHTEEEYTKLVQKIQSKDNEIKNLISINNNLTLKIDKNKTRKLYLDEDNISNQIEVVKQLLLSMKEIESNLIEIAKYDVIKRKHRDNYIRIKDDYFRDIPCIESYYNKFLEELKISKSWSLKNIFELSSIEDIINQISSSYTEDTSYKNIKIDLKKIKKYMSYFIDPLTKYMSYLQNN